MNATIKTSLFLYLNFCMVALAQTQEIRKSNLQQIALERAAYNSLQKEKAREYARKHNVPVSYTDSDGNHVLMIGVDELSGKPVYLKTLNAGASLTTGAAHLHSGGRAGLNLEGDGIVVGVWDDGYVQDHAEFGNRIISRQGDQAMNHATHVTGTIIAAGLQVSAKGMAPKAKATTWYFDNDDAEMAALATPDQTSLLFSNHSYGISLGWHNGSWGGNTTISSSEDHRFGFYSSKSRSIDQIAFNAPYYTIVWAAGNDRSDSGNGPYPPDGNGGTGYDCLGPDGVAKNNITVGAVNKVLNYTGPTSVQMSSFSSWGPTDDGRIKPDLVAAGVGLFSTGASSTYRTESGTSMAAPNVTGSLVLLQELYKNLHAGNFMRAATLKALAVHTAREAGFFPGPDYSFGWGLLDVEAAAQLLLAEDQQSVIVSEKTLLNGQIYEFLFDPQPGTKITATIVWTDPPGTPVAAALDPANSMLVNDLDLLLIDGSGNNRYPWTLDPVNPASAAKNTVPNNRDNVEKVEFTVPASGISKLRVTHKGQILANDKQDFSLILTYTPSTDQRTAYYWIGDSGEWSDPSNWSLTSGGSPAGQVPDANARAIFTESSFGASGDEVALTGDVSCGSLTWLANRKTSLSLNGHTLQLNGNLIIFSDTFSISTPGVIELTGGASTNSQINLKKSDFSKAELVFNGADESTWTINGTVNGGTIDVRSGKLIAKAVNLKLDKLISNTTNTRVIDLTGTEITDITESVINGLNLELVADDAVIKLKPSESALVNWNDLSYGGKLEMQGGQMVFTGSAVVNDLSLSGNAQFNGNNRFEALTVAGGTVIEIQAGSQQTLTSNVTFNSASDNRVSIASAGAGTSSIEFDGHFKKCFDFLDINGVNLAFTDDATINAGANSTFTNAVNWTSGLCSNALFSDFSFSYNCQGALTEFTNLSEGNITSYTWDFGDPSSIANTSTEQSPRHIYESTGTYTVSLTVNNGSSVKTYTQQILVGTNDLQSNRVIVAQEKLFSYLTADGYQWFKNGDPLEGATGRSYEFNGAEGQYFVITKSALCNMPSSSFIVSATDEEEAQSLDRNIVVYPNPAVDQLTVKVPLEMLPARLSIVNSLGQSVFLKDIDMPENVINVGNMVSGIYVLKIQAGKTFRRKLLIDR